MNREEYLKYKKLRLLEPVAYEHYKERSDSPMNYEEFQIMIKLFIMAGSKYTREIMATLENKDGLFQGYEKRLVDYTVDWEMLWEYYDIKFNIIGVIDVPNKKIIDLL